MCRREGEDGSGELSSEENHAAAFFRKRQTSCPCNSGVDTSPGSGFMLLCFAFVPKHLAGRLDFAYFGSFSCSFEQAFPNGEKALWQHFLNAALMTEHIQ